MTAPDAQPKEATGALILPAPEVGATLRQTAVQSMTKLLVKQRAANGALLPAQLTQARLPPAAGAPPLLKLAPEPPQLPLQCPPLFFLGHQHKRIASPIMASGVKMTRVLLMLLTVPVRAIWEIKPVPRLTSPAT